MYQASTPTHYFNCPDDPQTYDKIVVSYEQFGQKILDKQKEELEISSEDNQFSITLTQEETNLFDCEQIAMIQVKVKRGEQVFVSPKYKLRVFGAINREVI